MPSSDGSQKSKAQETIPIHGGVANWCPASSVSVSDPNKAVVVQEPGHDEPQEPAGEQIDHVMPKCLPDFE